LKVNNNTKTKESGFTLIELLIVIVIIGILAVALLAAVDPLEQIRRGRDTETLKAARDFMSAAERYYALNEDYPWTSADQADVGGDWATYGQDLEDTGELRARFDQTSPVAQSKLVLTEETTSEAVHVCFDPESSQMTSQACCGTISDSGFSCGSAGSGDYFCVPDCSN